MWSKSDKCRECLISQCPPRLDHSAATNGPFAKTFFYLDILDHNIVALNLAPSILLNNRLLGKLAPDFHFRHNKDVKNRIRC